MELLAEPPEERSRREAAGSCWEGWCFPRCLGTGALGSRAKEEWAYLGMTSCWREASQELAWPQHCMQDRTLPVGPGHCRCLLQGDWDAAQEP